MKEADTCPDCGNETSIIKLGSEPARQICGRFGCEYDGETLTRAEAEARVNA
jgi:ribosomal protein S27AE